MRSRHGTAAMEDLTVLFVAVVSFSLFFTSLAAAYTLTESRIRGERLEAAARNLLEAVMTDTRWTSERGLFLAAALRETSPEDVVAIAGAHPSLVVIRNLRTTVGWTFGTSAEGDRRTAATSANVVAAEVDPARVVVTVWWS